MEAVRAVQGIRWRSDFDKFVLSANFRRRGWVEVKEDDPDPTQWDLYWACTSTIRTIFTAGSEQRLQPGQVINHFPGHLELTRKV